MSNSIVSLCLWHYFWFLFFCFFGVSETWCGSKWKAKNMLKKMFVIECVNVEQTNYSYVVVVTVYAQLPSSWRMFTIEGSMTWLSSILDKIKELSKRISLSLAWFYLCLHWKSHFYSHKRYFENFIIKLSSCHVSCISWWQKQQFSISNSS